MGNRKAKEKQFELTNDEISRLSNSTGYTEEKIIEYYNSFKEDCPSGRLSKKKFRLIYKQVYPHSRSSKFCDRIFDTFDYNRDSYLDFSEFLTALTTTMNGDVKEKLTCAFRIYDLNGDGILDKKEMRKIFIHIYDMFDDDTFRSRQSYKLADRNVDLIFEKFDLNKDDTLTLDEFIQGCLNDEHLSKLLTFNYQQLSNLDMMSDLSDSANISINSSLNQDSVSSRL